MTCCERDMRYPQLVRKGVRPSKAKFLLFKLNHGSPWAKAQAREIYVNIIRR